MEDFNNILLSLAQNNSYSQEDYTQDDNHQEELPEESATEVEPDNDYDDLMAQNEELKGKIAEYENTASVSNAQSEYYDYMQTQDMNDPNFAMDLIMSDDLFEGLKDNPTSSATWLKKKDPSVNLEGMSNRLISYLEKIPQSIRDKLVATSGNDSDAHAKGSAHYKSKAIDLRYSDELYNYILKDSTFGAAGLKVLNPNHGTAKHIHIEEKKYGGKYKTTIKS